METGWHAPRVRQRLQLYALPGPAIVGFVMLTLIGVTAVVSLASIDPNTYALQLFPPSTEAYGRFAERAGDLTVKTAVRVLTVLAIAAVPAAATGYYLALKAPFAIRRIGVFLLVGAWALTFARTMGTIPFAAPSWMSWLLPGMALGLPESAVFIWAYGALPLMALGAYSGFRGDLLGWDWPSLSAPRIDRFLREALPRGTAGMLLGAGAAGAFVLVDMVGLSTYGGTGQLGLEALMFVQLANPTGIPLAAVVTLVFFLTVIAAFVGVVLVSWLCRRAATILAWPRHIPRSPSSEDTLSIVSHILGAGASVFVFFVLYVPLFVATVFSFNSGISLLDFSGWSLQWYLGRDIGTPAEIAGIFRDEVYLTNLAQSLAFAAGASAAGALLALLAVRGLPAHTGRTRLLVRAGMFAALATPLYLMFVASLLGGRAFRLEGDALLVLFFLAHLPFATGVAFHVLAGSGTWHGEPVIGPRWSDWWRPGLSSGLVTFALVFNLAWWQLQTSGGSWHIIVWWFVEKKWWTPTIDAALVPPMVLTFAALGVAWGLLRGREVVRI